MCFLSSEIGRGNFSSPNSKPRKGVVAMYTNLSRGRFLLLALTLLMVPCLGLQAQTSQTSLTTIPMQLSTPGFAPLVRVTCNNSVEATFLVATGINNCYITNRLADQLQLSRFKLSENNEACILSSLRFGDVSFSGQMAFIVVNRQQLDIISQWMARDQSIDGLLGESSRSVRLPEPSTNRFPCEP